MKTKKQPDSRPPEPRRDQPLIGWRHVPVLARYTFVFFRAIARMRQIAPAERGLAEEPDKGVDFAGAPIAAPPEGRRRNGGELEPARRATTGASSPVDAALSELPIAYQWQKRATIKIIRSGEFFFVDAEGHQLGYVYREQVKGRSRFKLKARARWQAVVSKPGEPPLRLASSNGFPSQEEAIGAVLARHGNTDERYPAPPHSENESVDAKGREAK